MQRFTPTSLAAPSLYRSEQILELRIETPTQQNAKLTQQNASQNAAQNAELTQQIAALNQLYTVTQAALLASQLKHEENTVHFRDISNMNFHLIAELNRVMDTVPAP